MAKLSSPPRILTDSYKGQDVPTWFENVFGIVNKGFEDIYRVCQGGLTVGDNLAAQFLVFSTTTPADYATGGFTPVTLAINIVRPQMVIVTSAYQDAVNLVTGTEAVGLPVGGWNLVNNSTIKINYVTGLSASTKYVITIKVE